MPNVTSQHNAFSGIRGLHPDAQVTLSGEGGIRQSGSRSWNPLAQLWKWATRSPAEAAANRATAQALVQAIRREHGDGIADMAAKQVGSQLRSGRPLTAYRIDVVLQKADQAAGRISTQNDRMLRELAPRLVDAAVQRYFGAAAIPQNGLVDALAYSDGIEAAVRSHPSFSRHAFEGDEAGFLRHFAGVAAHALEDTSLAACLPHSFALARQDAAPGERISDRLQAGYVGSLGLAEDVQSALSMAGTMLASVAETLASKSTAELSASDALVRLGQIGMLTDMTGPPRPGQQDRLSELGDLPPQGGELRDALGADAALLVERLGERLGFGGLDPSVRGALMEASRLAGSLEMDVGEGRIGRLIGGAEADDARLGACLATIDQARAESPQARVLLQAVREQVQAALAGRDHAIGQSGLAALEGDQRHPVTEMLRIGVEVRAAAESGDWSRVATRGGDWLEELGEAISQVDPGANRDPAAAELARIARADAQRSLEVLQAFRADAVHASAKGFRPDDVAALRARHLDVPATLERFTAEEGRLLASEGFGIIRGLEYKAKGVPIHPRTLVVDFSDENVVGERVALSGGQASRPWAVSYRLPGGEVRPMVFKEARPGEGYCDGAEALGIPREDARMVVRNVATRAVDELLGFDLVPETRIGELDGRLGMVMGFAAGSGAIARRTEDVTDSDTGQMMLAYRDMIAQGMLRPEDLDDMMAAASLRMTGDGRILQDVPYAVEDFDYADPGLRRALVGLQLLDAITAQADRHGGNYIVSLDGEGRFAGLKAIDNDQSFGTRVTDPNELLRAAMGGWKLDVGGMRYGNSSFNGVLMPTVIDREMARAVRAITPEALRGALAGLLAEPEVDAAVARLVALQRHVDALDADGRVISTDAWGGELASRELESEHHSYVGRDQRLTGLYPVIRYEELGKEGRS